jgi:hypothetical protein
MTPPARMAPDSAMTRLWYYAILSEEQLVDGALAGISQQFADVVNAAGSPDGACLFASLAGPSSINPTEERALEETVGGRAVFFSPASISTVAELIVSSRARPTPPPDRCQVELLVGNPQDWDLLPRSSH